MKIVAALTIAVVVTPTIGGPPVSAVDVTRQVFTTGLNADGQLGDGSTVSRYSPAPALLPLDITNIASGREHGYALDSAGHVYAWGDNSLRAIGDGTALDRATPVQLALSGVVRIEAGHYHGIALRSDGTVWTWGYGGLGQLGLGSLVNRSSPTQVPGVTGIVDVAAGRDMSYALKSDGTVLAWGGNTFGEVGDGTVLRRPSPVAVVGLVDVVELAGGRNHALAIRADGSVWAWGANERGQLGVGSTVSQTRPVRVPLPQVRHVDAGAEHSVAVLADGTVRTWGRGQRGQLGLGTTTSRTTPAPVPGLTGIAEVGDGRDQTFAITESGQVWAWGFNDTGQLGDGTTTTRLTPVTIAGLEDVVAAQGGRGMTLFMTSSTETVEPDTVPPSVPGTPVASSTASLRVDLAWTASTDDRATVITYLVYRDDRTEPVASISTDATGTVTYVDSDVIAGARHTYRVAASDGTNVSATSGTSADVVVTGPSTQVILASDFATGLTGWTTTGAIISDPIMGSDTPPSARAAVTNTAAHARRSFSAQSSVCASVDVRVESVTGTVRYSLMKLRNAQGASVGRVEVDRAGALTVRADVPGTVLQTGATLTLSSWHTITLCATVGAGRLSVALDGTAVGDWSVGTGTAFVSSIQIGDNSTRTAVVNIDDVVVTTQN